MDDDLTDQYEKQLYTVFKTFDVKNEEALDKPAVLQLCDALQLGDRGPALADELFSRRSRPASFAQFRAALLRELCRDTTPRRQRRTRTDLDPARRLDADGALALCRRLQVRGVDRALVERVLPPAGATVGEFFEHLNQELTTSIEDAREAASSETAASGSGNVNISDEIDSVDADVLVEAWERCNVAMPRRLLVDLGFGEVRVRVADLQRALDEEVRAIPPGEYGGARALLAAALAIARMQGEVGSRAAARAAAERDKLRADLAEANRRARLLAQDVDDNHARIETELRDTVRRMETRHSAAARAQAADLAAERDRVQAATSELAAAAAAWADTETRLRREADQARVRVVELEARLAANEQLRATVIPAPPPPPPPPPPTDSAAEQRAQIAAARADELALQNAALRDRCDELVAALERRGPGYGGGAAYVASWHEEAAALLHCEPDESGSSLGSGCPVTAVRSDAAVQTERRAGTDVAAQAGGAPSAAGDLVVDIATNVAVQTEVTPPSITMDVALQTDGRDDAGPPASVDQLDQLRQRHQQEIAELNETIELQAGGLEALREEVERCEQYWADKLAGERAAAASDAAAADQRLADLLNKVVEYETRFERGGALPPLSEAPALEEQFTALDDEFTAYRRQAEGELSRCVAETARLQTAMVELRAARDQAQAQLAAAEQRLRRQRAATPALRCSEGGGTGDGRRQLCGEACACACSALWARLGVRGARGGGVGGAGGVAGAAGAAAARAGRLAARLAAAERLLADLFSENCRLHARLPAPL